MVVKNHKQLLLHDGAILTGNAVISETKYSIIFAMYDHARIKTLDYNTEVLYMGDNVLLKKCGIPQKLKNYVVLLKYIK